MFILPPPVGTFFVCCAPGFHDLSTMVQICPCVIPKRVGKSTEVWMYFPHTKVWAIMLFLPQLLGGVLTFQLCKAEFCKIALFV